MRESAGRCRAQVGQRGKSLFSAGIAGVAGDFNAQDAVALCDAQGAELGRGLCNYSAAEVDKIKVLWAPPCMSASCADGLQGQPADAEVAGCEQPCHVVHQPAVLRMLAGWQSRLVLGEFRWHAPQTHCCMPEGWSRAAQGVSSKDFVAQLGYLGSEEIVHRDNICLLSRLPGSSNAPSRSGSPAPGAAPFLLPVSCCTAHATSCAWRLAPDDA